MNAPSSYPLISIKRNAFDDSPWYGAVVQESERFVAIQNISDRYDFDGYRVFRRKDITTMEKSFEKREFIEAALRIKGLKPLPPKPIELSSMRALMDSAQQQFGVLVISREKLYPDEVEVGTVRMASEKTYVLRWLTPQAEWENDDRPFRYQDVTMVEYGGEYENTLLMVANARAPSA